MSVHEFSSKEEMKAEMAAGVPYCWSSCWSTLLNSSPPPPTLLSIKDNEPESEPVSESATVHVQWKWWAVVICACAYLLLLDCDMSSEWHWPLRTKEKEKRKKEERGTASVLATDTHKWLLWKQEQPKGKSKCTFVDGKFPKVCTLWVDLFEHQTGSHLVVAGVTRMIVMWCRRSRT